MKILIIEDDRAVREALQRVLNIDGHEVVEAADGHSGLSLIRSSAADLVLLDWVLPGIEGIEILRTTRADGNDVPVIMLTARDTVIERVAGLESGADDYMVKPFAIAELRARITASTRRIAAPMTRQQGKILTCSDLTMNTGRHALSRAGESISLSRIEWQLLEVLMDNCGTVCSRSKLHLDVWDYDFGSDSNTLEVHIGYLRRKIEESGRRRLIHTVRSFGYILEER